MSKVFEIVYRYAIPSIRREVALELLRRRFSEVEVSRALGISKSLVSRYVRGERGKLLEVGHHPVVREAVQRIAQLVEVGMASAYEVEEEIVRAAVGLLSVKALCGLHGRLDGRFDPARCRLCIKVFGSQH